MFNGSHEYAAKDRLKDGTAVIVRAIRASDKDLLQQLMKDVSAEAIVPLLLRQEIAYQPRTQIFYRNRFRQPYWPNRQPVRR